MESDAVGAVGRPQATVMAAVEEGTVEEFIIADVAEDEAFLRLPLAEAASLPAWR
ncbi:MAG: hypothetical protein ABEH64_04605 [Salinirussus sp.]